MKMECILCDEIFDGDCFSPICPECMNDDGLCEDDLGRCPHGTDPDEGCEECDW